MSAYREINISISANYTDVYTSTEEYGERDLIPLGREGENEATRLIIYTDGDYDGWTFAILWDGELYEDVTEYAADSDGTDYDVPDDYTTKGNHVMEIELHGPTGEIKKTHKMYFNVC